jgi:hypothetical protein
MSGTCISIAARGVPMTRRSQKQSIFLYNNGSYTLRWLRREKKNGGRSLQGFYESQADVVDLQLPSGVGIILHSLDGPRPP